MRYLGIPDIKFTNVFNETKVMFGVRECVIFDTYMIHDKPIEQEFDDLATQLIGDGAEIFTYKLREQNVEKLLCFNFNETSITRIMIPPLR